MHIIVSWILVTLMVITWYYDIYCDTLMVGDKEYFVVWYLYKGETRCKILFKL
jgi:hypothetical protein